MGAGIKYRSLRFLGFPEYRVGDDGSLWRWVKYRRMWKRLRNYLSAQGYCMADLRHISTGIKKSYKIQHLVLRAFVGPPPKGTICCHANDIRTDNRLENLRWDTYKSNVADSVRNGTSRRSHPGESNPSSKLTKTEVIKIREMFFTGNYTQGQLAEMFDTCQVRISSIVRGQTWKRAGGPIVRIGRGINRYTRQNRHRSAISRVSREG